MSKCRNLLILGCLIILLAGCESWLSGIRVVTIEQGNIIKSTQIAKLKTGMSKDEVQALLGEPIKSNTFDPYRWDYIYVLDKPYRPKIEKCLTIYFSKEDRLVRYTTRGFLPPVRDN